MGVIAEGSATDARARAGGILVETPHLTGSHLEDAPHRTRKISRPYCDISEGSTLSITMALDPPLL